MAEPSAPPSPPPPALAAMSFSSSNKLLLSSASSSTPTTPIMSRKAAAMQQPRMNFDSQLAMEAYLRANPGIFPHPDDIRHLVEQEFPDNSSKPSSANCDDSILRQDLDNANQLPYQIGQWIERLGDDMEWHLEPIRRIVVFQDTPNVVWYKTEADVLVRSDRARCSEEGVKRQFGMRPHLWQQWCTFQLEDQLRFQPQHEYDFEAFQCEPFARVLWHKWLRDARNVDFARLHDSKPQHMQQKLEHHMLSPFRHMDEIVTEWDLASARSSVYVYNSLLGSGYGISLVMFLIQIIVPFLLLLYQVRSSPRFPNFSAEPNVSSLDLETIISTSWEGFCFEPVGIDGVLMQYVVFFVYWSRVVPAVVFSFYDTVGDSPTVQSRINSLRTLTWDQGDDTVAMKCGFKLERYMNSVYIAAINLVMLMCIFLSDNTVSIILNALAIEFVYDFDREVAALFWFDENWRYLRAGVLEMALRGTLLLEYLHDAESFCWFYDCNPDEYAQRMGKAGKTIYSPRQSELDRHNPVYLDAKDKLWEASAVVAQRLHRPDAVWQFKEQVTNFGMVDTFFYNVLPKRFRSRFATGVFNRYDYYLTWSRWEQVLFLPNVPEVGQVSSAGKSWSAGAGAGVMNFNETSIQHPIVRFVKWCVQALLFQEIWSITKVTWRRKEYALLPFVIVDGVFEWFTFLFILFIFPAGLVAYMFLIIYCERVMTNNSESWLYNGDVVFVG